MARVARALPLFAMVRRMDCGSQGGSNETIAEQAVPPKVALDNSGYRAAAIAHRVAVLFRNVRERA